jgi:LemA protein
MNFRKFLPWIVVAVIILFAIVSYNGLVEVQADAKTSWAKVESAYQRRNDLIGNLVKVVQKAANYEKGTLTEVVEARAKATSITIDPSKATPEQMAQFQQAQEGLKGSLSRLLLTVEKYPELRAIEGFNELQSQIEGTENRINVARDRFNDAVNIYDQKTKKFPSVIFAKLFGFNEMNRFKSDEGAQKAPDVNQYFDKTETK